MLCGPRPADLRRRSRRSQALTDTAELLDSIETQTLALMNQGVTLDRVLHEVEVPEHLRELPYLQPVYDHPQFIVRNVWRRYGGWYDGEPDNLLPAPRAEQAREWVDAGRRAGAACSSRARELAAAGDHRLACHLVEFAVLFEPGSAEAHEVRAEVYARAQRRAGVVDGPQHPRPRRPRQPRGQARPRRRSVSDLGGDPACWLDQLCEACGAVLEKDVAHQCQRAGADKTAPRALPNPDRPARARSSRRTALPIHPSVPGCEPGRMSIARHRSVCM